MIVTLDHIAAYTLGNVIKSVISFEEFALFPQEYAADERIRYKFVAGMHSESLLDFGAI